MGAVRQVIEFLMQVEPEIEETLFKENPNLRGQVTAELNELDRLIERGNGNNNSNDNNGGKNA